MAKRILKEKQVVEKVAEKIEEVPEAKSYGDLKNEMDDLLDEVDTVLEHESFAANFLQAGGE